MDYEALYRFRFQGVDPAGKQKVWDEIAQFLHARCGRPRRVLDPACGSGEFVIGVPAEERWAADVVPPSLADPTIRVLAGRYQDLDLPTAHFDLIFLSNVLEHLADPDEVQLFLARAKVQLAPGGVVAIMGPNFKYCAAEYFDCADHTLALTNVSVVEHCVAAGYDVVDELPRFLPYSFRSRLPSNPALTRLYLRSPWAWRVLGKQFLVVARPST